MRRLGLGIALGVIVLAGTAGCQRKCETDPRIWVERLLPKELGSGFTLLAPVAGREVFWITTEGCVAKRLEVPWPISFVEQLPGGNLLMLVGMALRAAAVELDANGEMQWQYMPEVGLLHHEAVRTPRDTTMLLVQLVHDDPPMVYDVIIEVDRAGKTVWSWDPLDHYDPRAPATGLDRGHPWNRMVDWLHMNGLDLFPNGDVLLSVRNLNRIVRISYPDGEIVWSWGDGVLGHQHAPKILQNGHILVFDNGSFRIPDRLCSSLPCSSRALELDPETGKIVWGFEPKGLYSLGFGDADRLANGNTLINFGQQRPGGVVLEVTPDGRVAWFLHTTLRTRYTFGGVPSAMLYRVQRVR